VEKWTTSGEKLLGILGASGYAMCMSSRPDDEEVGWLKEHVRGFVRKRKARLTCKCAAKPNFGCFPDDEVHAKFIRTLTQTWAVRDFATAVTLTFFFYSDWNQHKH
jgi:hypothetical protein